MKSLLNAISIIAIGVEILLANVKHSVSTLPVSFRLNQNYPNPFNPTTVISYTIPKSSLVVLKVYNILGQVISTLKNGYQKAGSYTVDFNGTKLSSGVYLYRLQADGFVKTMKMELIK